MIKKLKHFLERHPYQPLIRCRLRRRELMNDFERAGRTAHPGAGPGRRTPAWAIAVLAAFAVQAACAVGAAAQSGAAADRAALEAFYDATDGQNWTDSTNWKTDAPLREWHGVTTDGAGRVTRLALVYNGLTGPISSELGRLTYLEGLFISDNSFTPGPIPDWLLNLTNLRFLNLAATNRTGPIPNWIGNLTAYFLQLSNNGLTGPIPDLTGLATLTSLRLAGNWGLSGPLLGDFPYLRELDISLTQVCARLNLDAVIEFVGRLCEESDILVDLAVFYTPAVRNATGGTAEIEAAIDLMVAETNYAYEASGVHHRVTLAGISEVQFDESSHPYYDLLWRFNNRSDGLLDDVWALVDRVGADIPILVLSGAGGLATTGSAFGWKGGALVGGDHPDASLTFMHELGHLMGLHHDRYTYESQNGGPPPGWESLFDREPAFGYVNQAGLVFGAESSRRWITSMAYGWQCIPYREVDGTQCSRIPRFSNPRQRYNGDPLGVPFGAGGESFLTGPADAAAVLNTTMPIVARTRDRVARPNRPPTVADTLPDRTVSLPGTLTVDVSRAFSDRDGDSLTYAVSSSSPGVVTVLAVGPRVTLTAVSTGAATIRVTVTDPGGLSASQSFAVTVGDPNRPPSAAAALADLTLTAGGMSEVDVSQAFTDPDGDPLTYAVSSSSPGVVTVLAVGARLTLTAVSTGAATIRVTATDPGGLSASQSFAVTVRRPFTDDPVRPGATPIRAVHFTELRTRIDGLRRAAGLAPFGWTDPVLRAGATPVRLVHLLELRQALDAAYRAAGRTPPSWTDAAPAAGTTPVRAVHITELRAAVTALE